MSPSFFFPQKLKVTHLSRDWLIRPQVILVLQTSSVLNHAASLLSPQLYKLLVIITKTVAARFRMTLIAQMMMRKNCRAARGGHASPRGTRMTTWVQAHAKLQLHQSKLNQLPQSKTLMELCQFQSGPLRASTGMTTLRLPSTSLLSETTRTPLLVTDTRATA